MSTVTAASTIAARTRCIASAYAAGDIAWLPILVIWFGYGLTTMTFVIVYTVIFPVVLNTVLGVRSIPVSLHRAALSLGASRAQVLREVVLPGALPNILTGLRNGLGYGWRALIAAEILKPFVRKDVYWVVRVHQEFQGRYYFHHFDLDRNISESIDRIVSEYELDAFGLQQRHRLLD